MLVKWKRVAREGGEEEGGGNRSGTNLVLLRCYLVISQLQIIPYCPYCKYLLKEL